MLNETISALNLISTAYNTYLSAVSSQLGISLDSLTFLITLATIWSLVWKGFALWKSAQRKQLLWFVVLLVVNSFGILEILYIFVFSRLSKPEQEKLRKSKKKPKRK